MVIKANRCCCRSHPGGEVSCEGEAQNNFEGICVSYEYMTNEFFKKW